MEMVSGRRKTVLATSSSDGKENASADEVMGEQNEAMMLDEQHEAMMLEQPSFASEIAKLRGRWELASVLNFLSVFKPLISDDLKLTAEEIENGLISPNSSLTQLHILLLKGILPASNSKPLDDSNVWVKASKTLASWWRWVAEGENPLTALKGEETSKYKELDPVSRLLILKALCEIRADQEDVASFINDSIKDGAELSSFRKVKIGGDESGTSYWYDANPVIGHRLYKEVYRPNSKIPKTQACLILQSTNLLWETLATNLEEFQRVVAELSTSKVAAEVSVAKIIDANAVPILQKAEKKKELELKRKERQMLLLNKCSNSHSVGVTRSCRTQRSINYAYDDYDRVMKEAIRRTEKGKQAEERREERKKHVESANAASTPTSPVESASEKANSTDDEENDVPHESGSEDDRDNIEDFSCEDEDEDEEDDGDDDSSESGGSSGSGISDQEEEKVVRNARVLPQKPKGSRWSERLSKVNEHISVETRNVGVKNKMRQRPTRNSAIDHIVSDSEEETSE